MHPLSPPSDPVIRPLAGRWRAVFPLLAFAVSCGRTAPPRSQTALPELSKTASSPQDLVVARVNGTPIFASEVSRQAANTKVTPREALDTLITVESLIHIAIKKKTAQGAQAEEGWRQLLAQAWIVRDLEPQLDPNLIPESTLRQFYERSKDAFDHSRLVHIATLDLYAFPKNGPVRRQEARQWSQELALELQKMSPRPSAAQLQLLAVTEKWSARGLKAGMTWQTDKQPYSEKVGGAALSLRDWGALSSVVEDEAGFHIVMHQGERAELHQTFEEAKNIIREGITPGWQQSRFNEIVTDLAAKSNVVVTPDLLVSQTLK